MKKIATCFAVLVSFISTAFAADSTYASKLSRLRDDELEIEVGVQYGKLSMDCGGQVSHAFLMAFFAVFDSVPLTKFITAPDDDWAELDQRGFNPSHPEAFRGFGETSAAWIGFGLGGLLGGGADAVRACAHGVCGNSFSDFKLTGLRWGYPNAVRAHGWLRDANKACGEDFKSLNAVMDEILIRKKRKTGEEPKYVNPTFSGEQLETYKFQPEPETQSASPAKPHA